jgi:pimeloyl-ACP methyl ester carboxylesterase
MLSVEALFHAWERRLAFRDDPERRVLDFEWGVDQLPRFSRWKPRVGEADEADVETLSSHAQLALAHSEEYFEASPVDDFVLDGRRLRFTSPWSSGILENDEVHADYFPASESGPAVVVLPQWNAREGAQEGLSKLLNRFGISALKLALPYHERRMPPELVRADYALSPNIGRTLQACRQAVLDTRASLTWLAERGHGPLGIIGTSLGSCIAFITFAHDARLDAGVFNHVSPYFADVVWRGISTRQVREGLERGVDLDTLRRLWLPLSPFSYYRRLKARARPTLLVHGRYDLSFPTDLSIELLRDFERLEIDHERFELPCGHYTTAKFPFNWMDGLRIATFLRRRLGRGTTRNRPGENAYGT